MKPSTDATVRASLVALAIGATAGCARGRVVQAPMLPASQSVRPRAAANAPAPPARRSGLPIGPGDRWTGTYTCRQGKTEMALLVEEVGALSEDDLADVGAILAFRFEGRGGYAPAAGGARMRGSYDAKERRLRLEGKDWIERPKGYALVNLVGVVDRDTKAFAGQVEGPGCSSFTAAFDQASASDRD